MRAIPLYIIYLFTYHLAIVFYSLVHLTFFLSYDVVDSYFTAILFVIQMISLTCAYFYFKKRLVRFGINDRENMIACLCVACLCLGHSLLVY